MKETKQFYFLLFFTFQLTCLSLFGEETSPFKSSEPRADICEAHSLFCLGLQSELAREDEQAVHYYQQAAALNNAYAQWNLGLMYEQGRGGLLQSFEQAVYYYQQAAAQNNAYAQYNLGLMYEQRHGGAAPKR